LPGSSLLDRLLSYSPAYGKFVYRLPPGASLLDVGCYDCNSLKIILGKRPDLSVYGVDIGERPACGEVLKGFRRADLNREKIGFESGSFDGIRAAHLLEHLEDLSLLREEIPRLLKSGGLVYLETPNENSLRVPSFRVFPEQDGPFNFHDDPTHLRPIAAGELRDFLAGAGLTVLDAGIVRNPFKVLFSPALVAGGLVLRKRSWLVAAAWEISGWCSYAVGRKP
jgi:SAM-dependent methyltransferase